jgi:hypothetical protein
VTAQVEKQRAHLRLRQIGVDPEKPSQSGTVTIAAPTSGSAHRLVRYALKPDPDKVMKLSRATWPTCHAIAGHIVGKCAPTRMIGPVHCRTFPHGNHSPGAARRPFGGWLRCEIRFSDDTVVDDCELSLALRIPHA